MSNRFVKIPTNEPDGEIVVFLKNIVLERQRFNSNLIYKVILGQKDSRSINENTYNELKHMLLREKFDDEKIVSSPVKDIPLTPPAHPLTSVQIKPVSSDDEKKQVTTTTEKKTTSPIPTRKPLISTKNVPKHIGFRR